VQRGRLKRLSGLNRPAGGDASSQAETSEDKETQEGGGSQQTLPKGRRIFPPPKGFQGAGPEAYQKGEGDEEKSL